MKILILSIVGIAVFLFTQRVAAFQIGSTSQILTKIESEARARRLEPALVKAVVKVESNFNPRAKNPSDPSYGLMQITPMLAQDYGFVKDYKNPTRSEIEMIYNVENNLYMGCKFLSRLMKTYSFNQAVQMYNVGEYGYNSGRRNSDYLSKVRVAYGIYS
ncbi:hypothetical protein ES702_07695 [subsurface metagenome]